MNTIFKKLLLCAAIVIGFSYFFFHKKYNAEKKGHIIVISGVSSSGKSSTARELHTLLAHHGMPYMLIKYDGVLETLPSQWVNFSPDAIIEEGELHQANKEGLIYIRRYDEKGPKIETRNGFVIKRLAKSVFPMVNVLASNGNNIIFEGAVSTYWLTSGKKLLQGTSAFFIFVFASQEERLKREKEKEGAIGQSRGQHESGNYYIPNFFDLEIDTTNISPAEAAQQIFDFVKPKIWDGRS